MGNMPRGHPFFVIPAVAIFLRHGTCRQTPDHHSAFFAFAVGLLASATLESAPGAWHQRIKTFRFEFLAAVRRENPAVTAFHRQRGNYDASASARRRAASCECRAPHPGCLSDRGATRKRLARICPIYRDALLARRACADVSASWRRTSHGQHFLFDFSSKHNHRDRAACLATPIPAGRMVVVSGFPAAHDRNCAGGRTSDG